MPKVLGFINQKWFQILTIGAALFFAAEQALKFTNNINFVPTVILLGAFLVPAAFVAYFYSQEQVLDKSSHLEIPLSLVAICFLAGGVVGSIVAGFFEYTTLSSSSVSTLFSAALIEEAAKLIFPIVIFMRDAIVLRQMDYFRSHLRDGIRSIGNNGLRINYPSPDTGNVGALQEILLIRGLLSPVGHAAWTGLVCAVLWRQREKTHKSFNAWVVGAFALAVIFHTVWDIAGTSKQLFVTYLGFIAVGIVSLTLLILRLRDARKTTKARQLQTPSQS